MTAAEYVLKASDISFSYPSYGSEARQLFKGLSFALQRGEMMLILGPPEAGKTTLSRILTGLVPRYTGGELSGTVCCLGRDLKELEPRELPGSTGLVFQDPHEQLITSRCDTEVAFPLESMGLPPEEMERRVHRALSFFSLADYAATDTAALSGGEQKKLLLAVQYAVDPPVWILDEALEELDAPSRRQLLDYLRKAGKSVLFFAAKLDRSFLEYGVTCGMLRGGELIFGTPREGHRLYEEARGSGLIPGLLPDSGGTEGSVRQRSRQPAEHPLLSVNRLRFTYPGGSPFELFIDSLKIRRGEVLGLAGPNGCGKSTLGLLLCGLYEPAEGTIALSLDSGELPLKAEERTRRIAYMFQNPDYQIFLPTVRDELAFGLEEAGLEKGEIEQRTAEAITLFGLPAGSAPPTLLSYGARKRLQAATYYLLERDLYILDEADAGLTYADMISIIGNLQERGSAVMLITHDALLAADICHRVVLMEGGRIMETLDSAAYRRRSLGNSR